MLSGTYKNLNDGIETEYTLVRSYNIGNTFEERYPLSDVDAEEIEAFARSIKLYILNDKKQLSFNALYKSLSESLTGFVPTLYTRDTTASYWHCFMLLIWGSVFTAFSAFFKSALRNSVAYETAMTILQFAKE